MKTICETKNLRKSIEAVMPGVESKPVTEVLSGIKIESKENKLVLSTSNMYNYYRSHMETNNSEDGATIVAAEKFYNIIKATNAENITLETKSKNNKNIMLTIKAGEAIFELSSYNETEFPAEPKEDENPEFSIELTGEQYKEIIRKTTFAVSKDSAKPIFTGLFVNVNENFVAFCATNTHRISEYELKDKKGNKTCNCLIPAQNMNAVTKVVDDNETVTLSFKNNNATIKTSNWAISIRTIEGKFPDYRRVFPKPEDKQTGICVNRAAFLNAVNRVSLCSDDNNGYMVIKMEADNDKLIVSSYGSNVSNSQETVTCKTEGKPIKTAFNAKYLIEYCKSTTAENINIALKNEISPVLVHGDDSDAYTYVLTPVRVIF